MKNFALVTYAAATMVFACGAAQAQTPKLVCKNYTNAWATPAAVVATTGTVNNAAADYLVAANADVNGYLEVTAFHNNCNKAGDFPTDIPVPVGGQITAVAAADLNASQVVTAVVDNTGTLQLRTWAVGGTAGISPLNLGYFSGIGLAAQGSTLGITALSSTAVVTAYQDPSGNFQLQQFNIPSGGVPAPVGEPLNLATAITGTGLCTSDGAPVQTTFSSPSTIAIATVDPSLGMFATAASDSQGNAYVDVWFLGGNGTFMPAGQSCVPSIEDYEYPSLSIAGGYGQVEQTSGKLHFFTTQHYAVTPLDNGKGGFNVLYWDISDTGALSRTGDKSAPGPLDSLPTVTATAAAMLPTGIPMSAFLQGIDIDVGWYGYTGEHVTSEVNPMGTGPGLFGVSAANAGASFPLTLLEVQSGTAYFVTATMVAYGNLPPMVAPPPPSTTPAHKAVFQLNLWSYPVVEFH
jgi:hypothetical protein